MVAAGDDDATQCSGYVEVKAIEDPESGHIIDEIMATETCDYLGNAATPCTTYELTDQAGLDTDVTVPDDGDVLALSGG